MNIELGYACLNTELRGFQSYTLSSLYHPVEVIRPRIIHNFTQTLEILRYNAHHNIKLYRLTSDPVPLASHYGYNEWQERTGWYWWEDKELLGYLEEIKRFSKEHGMRLTFHPGQYNVLNSPYPEIVNNTIRNLYVHWWLLDKIGGEGLVIHVGGVYGNKKKSMNRWMNVYNSLPEEMKSVIMLENDDKSYTVEDVLGISRLTGVTPILDVHHHKCNPSPNLINNTKEIVDIWTNKGKEVKIHVSSGLMSDRDRRHADFVTVKDYERAIELFEKVGYDNTLWIMLECKMKEKALHNLRGGGRSSSRPF